MAPLAFLYAKEIVIMKRLAAGLFAATLLAAALPASAGGRGDRHDRWEDYGHRPHQHHRHHRPHANPWAWGAAGLALGGAIFAIEAAPPVVVAPVVVPPIRPPGRLWYFCEAYGAYYPQVQYCPGGWRTVQ
jgi:hypothetical protein